MCGIASSFNKDTFYELIKLNSYRGAFSHSMTLFDVDTYDYQIYKDFGPFNVDLLDLVQDNHYIIGHNQAPTGGLIENKERIHPAIINNNLMWHNGIMKNAQKKELKEKYNWEWDTKLFLNEITARQNTLLSSPLSNIDGSFSCIYFDGKKIRMFRNSSCILYFDEDLNVSSTKFSNSKLVEYDIIYELNIQNESVIIEDTFKNINTPFFY